MSLYSLIPRPSHHPPRHSSPDPQICRHKLTAISGNARISPHIIRHTTATHLLRAGVDINTIRSWLGHVSIDTTNIYAEVDLERKAQMLKHSTAVPATCPAAQALEG